MKAPKVEKNDARQAGVQASHKVLFGENSRFAVFAVHTRFDAVQWFVADAERPDDLGHATVIRQEPTFEAAVAGLTTQAAHDAACREAMLNGTLPA